MYFSKQDLEELTNEYKTMPAGNEVVYSSMKVRHDVLKLIADIYSLRKELDRVESKITGFSIKNF